MSGQVRRPARIAAPCRAGLWGGASAAQTNALAWLWGFGQQPVTGAVRPSRRPRRRRPWHPTCPCLPAERVRRRPGPPRHGERRPGRQVGVGGTCRCVPSHTRHTSQESGDSCPALRGSCLYQLAVHARDSPSPAPSPLPQPLPHTLLVPSPACPRSDVAGKARDSVVGAATDAKDAVAGTSGVSGAPH